MIVDNINIKIRNRIMMRVAERVTARNTNDTTIRDIVRDWNDGVTSPRVPAVQGHVLDERRLQPTLLTAFRSLAVHRPMINR